MQQTLRPLSDAHALGEAGNVAEAVEIIRAHAERGNDDALFNLGDLYWRGFGVEQDYSRARELMGRASDAGHPVGIRAYTNLLASGVAGGRNWSLALTRLRGEAQYDSLRKLMFEVIRGMDLTPTGDPARISPGERLSMGPNVVIFRKAFTLAECDFLVALAEPTYERSLVIMDARDVPDPIRTSDGSTIHWLIEDPATHAINRRLAALTGTPVYHGEPLQILRYRPGQQYRPHNDWLAPPNRRIVTALIYLNDGYGGGETEFVKTGLKVKGRKGDVLAFVSALPNGELDPLSEHAGLPVTSGTKYLASRWIRELRHVP